MNYVEKIVKNLNGRMNGKNQGMACCPAHDDKNPSLSVTYKDENLLIHCFAGCDQVFVINKLRELDLWPKNSISSEIAQLPTPLKLETPKPLIESKMLNAGAKAFAEERRKHQEVQSFLWQQRRINQSILDEFEIGFNRIDKRISIPVHNELGQLVEIRQHKPAIYRNEDERKVIPHPMSICSAAKLFPIEMLNSNRRKLTRDNANEYLQDPDNLAILENLDVLEKDILLIVEGELDALTAISNHVNAISNTCGANTWNNELSLQIVKSGVKEVVIALDNDEAGEKGTQKRVESLLNAGITVKKISWPCDRDSGHDVTDEIIKYGRDSLYKLIHQADVCKPTLPSSDVIYLSEVTAEPIKWCIEPLLALEKVSLLEGEPGIGKSFLALNFASRVTINAENPILKDKFVSSGKVLLMSAEDGLSDTIKPRLEKMNYDPTKIFAPKELFTLDEKGFKTLESLLNNEKPILVIIDPIMPFLDGKKDSNKASDMRPIFKNLSQLAIKYSCAILVVRHLAKNTELKGVSRGLGSIDISAAVRSIMQVSRDTKDPALNIVSHIKSNISKKASPFGYRIIDDIFILETTIKSDVDDSELTKASVFLKDNLIQGPVNAVEIIQRGESEGFSKATLNRAKKAINIKSKRTMIDEHNFQWKWQLPNNLNKNEDDQDSQDSLE